MKTKSLFFLLIVVLSACKSDKSVLNNYETFSSDKSDIKAYNLISPQAAHEWITKKPDVYIPVQVSKEKDFIKEHIPGALNVWRPDYGSDIVKPYGGLIPSKDKLENLLQTLGFQDGKKLLLYDTKANVDALRLAWVLNLYGFDDFKIINGGLSYWKELKLKTNTVKAALPHKTNFTLGDDFDDSAIAYFDDVLKAIQDSNTIIVDTREYFEFVGLPYVNNGKVLPYKKGAFNSGSIPSAIHLNWSKLADLNGDHRIKSEKDLRYDLAMNGVSKEKDIILYCQSGSRTSHTYYVLKHVLGYENVKNYDGSWIEWSYRHSKDHKVPIQQLSTQKQIDIVQDSLNANL